MKTEFAKHNDIDRSWWLVDLEDRTLGRAATRIASVLSGKNKPTYAPNDDTGDFVVVINAAKVKLTGKKWTDKVYYSHTGYFGGIRQATAGEVRAKHPERLVYSAVWGMLPKNRLGRRMFKKLRVYGGAEHPHAGQEPRPLEL